MSSGNIMYIQFKKKSVQIAQIFLVCEKFEKKINSNKYKEIRDILITYTLSTIRNYL